MVYYVVISLISREARTKTRYSPSNSGILIGGRDRLMLLYYILHIR